MGVSTILKGGGGSEIGEVIAYAGANTPDNFLDCIGQAVSRTTYSRLFAILGTSHGSGDGATTFNLPDYRGRFLRGVSGSSANDPDKTSRTAMNTGGNTGNAVGSVQTDDFKSHAHLGGVYHVVNGFAAGNPPYSGASQIANTVATGGTETRPTNAYVKYMICFA